MPLGRKKVNLLVTIVIIAAMMAILVPAVQKVRAAANRMVCQNNLRQHAIALQNYESTFSRFPSGTMPNPDLPPEQRLSFHVALVPYMECDNLYKLFALNEAWDSDRNVGVLAHRKFKRNQCPMWIDEQKADPDLTASGHLAVTHYVGVAGVGADAATRPAGAPGIGVFGYDRATKMDDVKDGLENTLMLIETGHDLAPWVRGGPGTVRAVGVDDGQFGNTHFRGGGLFSQRRSAEFYVVMCDGSVRVMQPTINPATLGALATIAGREEIPAEW